jgi:hypothetical protein
VIGLYFGLEVFVQHRVLGPLVILKQSDMSQRSDEFRVLTPAEQLLQ